jgi:hypothetical protein
MCKQPIEYLTIMTFCNTMTSFLCTYILEAKTWQQTKQENAYENSFPQIW